MFVWVLHKTASFRGNIVTLIDGRWVEGKLPCHGLNPWPTFRLRFPVLKLMALLHPSLPACCLSLMEDHLMVDAVDVLKACEITCRTLLTPGGGCLTWNVMGHLQQNACFALFFKIVHTDAGNAAPVNTLPLSLEVSGGGSCNLFVL